MRLIEISGEGRYLSVERGFLTVKRSGEQFAKIPLDQILGIIGASHGITLSQNLLTRLADLGIPYVVCNAAFSPVSLVWPLQGHHLQSRAIRNQLAASRPLQKRLWQAIVREKIRHQAIALECIGESSQPLQRLVKKVRSGDPGNCEAQAARLYWTKLFGRNFTRNRDGDSPNDLLNYGYTIIRSAMARAVAGCGLHPSVSLNHSNQFNPFVLVDDLVEPFRPFVDLRVHGLIEQQKMLDKDSKSALVETLHLPCSGPENSTTLLNQIQTLARSLSASFEQGQAILQFPQATDLEWRAYAGI